MPLIVPVTTCVIGAMRDESKRPLEDLAIGLSRLCQFSIHPADELFMAKLTHQNLRLQQSGFQASVLVAEDRDDVVEQHDY
jgi:hypothetical protein